MIKTLLTLKVMELGIARTDRMRLVAISAMNTNSPAKAESVFQSNGNGNQHN